MAMQKELVQTLGVALLAVLYISNRGSRFAPSLAMVVTIGLIQLGSLLNALTTGRVANPKKFVEEVDEDTAYLRDLQRVVCGALSKGARCCEAATSSRAVRFTAGAVAVLALARLLRICGCKSYVELLGAAFVLGGLTRAALTRAGIKDNTNRRHLSEPQCCCGCCSGEASWGCSEGCPYGQEFWSDLPQVQPPEAQAATSDPDLLSLFGLELDGSEPDLETKSLLDEELARELEEELQKDIAAELERHLLLPNEFVA